MAGGYHMQQTTQGSPQRRYLSEGDMLRQNNELSYARSTNTSDNIRELAGSPQKGVYVWKNTSPNYNSDYVPTSMAPSTNPAMLRQQPQQQINNLPPVLQRFQQQQQEQQQKLEATNGGGGFHPALRGGVQVFPPSASPQIKRKTANTRPISFVRALEMTDSIEMAQKQNNGQQNNTQQSGGKFWECVGDALKKFNQKRFYLQVLTIIVQPLQHPIERAFTM